MNRRRPQPFSAWPPPAPEAEVRIDPPSPARSAPSENAAAVIREEIESGGPIPFARFMELALYHPEHGYYASGRAALGRRGDYFTSVSVGPLFGRLLAEYIAALFEAMGSPARFAIVEQGAASGDLAHDILTAIQNSHPRLFHAAHYIIVEPFEKQQARQQQHLADFIGKMDWHSTVEALAPFEGIHLSNELLDAFPVHLVLRVGRQWQEKFVTFENGDFAFVDQELSTPRLATFLAQLPSNLPEDYTTEVNLAAHDWIAAISRRLTRGCVLAIDYGCSRAEYYAPSRHTGTLSCYRRHRRDASPLESPGQKDITAHVDFTTLAETGVAAGLDETGFTDQHHFLVALAAHLMQRLGREDILSEKERRAFATLMHPESMGTQFKILGLTRNVDVSKPLPGFPPPSYATKIAGD